MTDKITPAATLPTADVKHKSKKFTAIWIVPVVAAIIGGWMVFQTALEEKAIIQVTFKSADGIEAGKSVVKLRDLTIGKVTKVVLGEDLTGVTITLEFASIPNSHFTDTLRLWVVKPRIGIGGISGLETLLSGSYIELDPGEKGGVAKKKFVGLEEPGNYQLGNPGTNFVLTADRLGSLQRGSPIKYRDIDVGKVLHSKLSDDMTYVDIEVFVRAPYDKLVQSETRFWDLSGVKVDVSAEGIKVNMESVVTLLAGGIGFTTAHPEKGEPAEADKVFNLFNTEIPEVAERIKLDVPIKLYFANGVNGLKDGAPVEYKGLRFGTVSDVGVEFDYKHLTLRTFAEINIEPGRLPDKKYKTDGTKEQHKENVYGFFKHMVKKGMRGQLQTSNFLTGQSLVTFDMFPGDKKRTIKFVDGVPIIPTVPETMVGLIHKVDKILTHLENVPMVEMGENISKAALGVSKLANSLNNGGVIGDQLSDVMTELQRSARSLRGMTNYLERHPEALLQGKGNE
jgi:paraquat-inducible protein B